MVYRLCDGFPCYIGQMIKERLRLSLELHPVQAVLGDMPDPKDNPLVGISSSTVRFVHVSYFLSFFQVQGTLSYRRRHPG